MKAYRSVDYVGSSCIDNPKFEVGYVIEGDIRIVDGVEYVSNGATLERLDGRWKRRRCDALMDAAERMGKGIERLQQQHLGLVEKATREELANA